MDAHAGELHDARWLEKRLRSLTEEYDRIVNALSAGSVPPGGRQEALRRAGELKEIMRLKALRDEVIARREEAQRLVDSEDRELAALAREESDALRLRQQEIETRLRSMLFPPDPVLEKNALVEIRQGTGGEEAALFARDLFRMYVRFAERRGYRIDIYDSHASERGGWKEIIFKVSGRGAYGAFRFEQGVHRVQRIPETESAGRIHTSAATVAVFPEAEETEIRIELADIRIDTFCASGAGGQHVNKTASAVRITHIPTGVVVSCQDERSQMQNRVRAMEILRARLRHLYETEKKSKIDAERRQQVGTGDRSEKIRTYNFPQNRVTDHRAHVTVHSLDRIMDGEMDELLAKVRENLGAP